ncbi:MAG TPA: flagellar biosynthesis anti-sigma factor FlgM [Fimbriimonadaceae bacterium]|nr:flagellar biosynthesis anti-sigma factor FlgM [Fimbriimonadaceae bacterium]
MRISDEQIRTLLGEDLANRMEGYKRKPEDERLIKRLTERIIDMPDREQMIADLKARIEAGTYNPTGDEIADAMIRRNIADRSR